MATFRVRTEVSRPPAEVFDRLSDCRNEEKWNSQVSKAELTSDEPVRLGTTFRTINRGESYAARIVTHDTPSELAFEVVGGPMDITATYALRSNGGPVVIDGVLEMRPKGWMKLMMPLLRRTIQKDLDRQYESFSSFCESPPPGAHTANGSNPSG
jgi:hypothetical protein